MRLPVTFMRPFPEQRYRSAFGLSSSVVAATVSVSASASASPGQLQRLSQVGWRRLLSPQLREAGTSSLYAPKGFSQGLEILTAPVIISKRDLFPSTFPSSTSYFHFQPCPEFHFLHAFHQYAFIQCHPRRVPGSSQKSYLLPALGELVT